MAPFSRLVAPLRPAGPRLEGPDDALIEGLLLSVDADELDELADRVDPGRSVEPVTDPRALAVLGDDDPAKLRGSAVLLRDSARRMVSLVPAWREGIDHLRRASGRSGEHLAR